LSARSAAEVLQEMHIMLNANDGSPITVIRNTSQTYNAATQQQLKLSG
jgi:hypothetical protein